MSQNFIAQTTSLTRGFDPLLVGHLNSQLGFPNPIPSRALVNTCRRIDRKSKVQSLTSRDRTGRHEPRSLDKTSVHSLSCPKVAESGKMSRHTNSRLLH